MRKFSHGLVLIPLGVVFVVFAVANRHLVTVSFDPFNSTDPAVGVTLPLFVVIIAVAILGVVAAAWRPGFGSGHWRRAARQHEADARQARDATGRSARRAMKPVAVRSAAPSGPAREGAGYGAGGRDKHGATL